MSDWQLIESPPPDELFDVIVSENGTRQANVIRWWVDGARADFEKSYCVKYPDGSIWWPEFTTHWQPYLDDPA